MGTHSDVVMGSNTDVVMGTNTDAVMVAHENGVQRAQAQVHVDMGITCWYKYWCCHGNA